MAVQGSTTAPGYIGLTGGSACTRAAEDMTMERQTGAFLVRGKNSVDSIRDGYLVRGSDGRMLGYEEVDFDSKFLAPPSLWTDGIIYVNNGQEGVAYSETLQVPDSGGGGLATSATLVYGTMYAGLVLDLSVPSAPTLIGTPTASVGWSYFEIKYRWANHKSVVQRYGLALRPA